MKITRLKPRFAPAFYRIDATPNCWNNRTFLDWVVDHWLGAGMSEDWIGGYVENRTTDEIMKEMV